MLCIENSVKQMDGRMNKFKPISSSNFFKIYALLRKECQANGWIDQAISSYYMLCIEISVEQIDRQIKPNKQNQFLHTICLHVEKSVKLIDMMDL